MKIICASNYDREDYQEKFVEPLPKLHVVIAQAICNHLNAVDESGPDYYKVVPDDYIPSVWEP